jgi:long-subunit fatty acid transport protein
MFEPDGDTQIGVRSGVGEFGDSLQLAMELRYRLAEAWQFFFAIGYDRSAGEHERAVDPAGTPPRTRLGAGIRYRWSKSLNLGLAYETADTEKSLPGFQRDDPPKDPSDSTGLIHFATFSATLEF